MPAALTLGKKVEHPHGQIAAVGYDVIRANGIVRYDQATLYYVNEIGLRISFENIEQIACFECVIETVAVSSIVIAIELPFGVFVVFKPLTLYPYPFLDSCEIIYGMIFQASL